MALSNSFWAKIEVMDNGCWKWTGSRTNSYPVFNDGTKTKTVARLIYENIYGPVPLIGKKGFVRSTCETLHCVNPEHLGVFPGSVEHSKEEQEASAKKRFDQYANKAGSGCWLWSGHILNTGMGYGQIKVGKKIKQAHRYAYEQFVGPIPSGMNICHRCDVPHCVNPAHLFAATQKENVADMHRKGRSNPPRGDDHPLRKDSSRMKGENNPAHRHPECRPKGEQHGMSKATDETVREIRGLAKEKMKHRDIGKLVGLSQTTVSKIVRGSLWAHVSDLS